MAEFPAFPLWTDAYLGDTTHLTTIEHGAYLLLLFAAWRSPTYDLPDDDRLLARFCRMTPGQWARIRDTIMAYWKMNEQGRWFNGRLLDERDAVRRKIAQRSDAGKASALKRLNRDATPVQRSGNGASTSKATATATVSSLRSDTRVPQTVALEITDAIGAYNRIAERVGWAQAVRLTQPRLTALTARLRECGGGAGWQAAMTRAAASDFLTGRTSRGNGHEGWAPDIDWFLKPKNLTKLTEGSYDNRKSAKSVSAHDKFLAAAESLIRDEFDGPGEGAGDLVALPAGPSLLQT